MHRKRPEGRIMGNATFVFTFSLFSDVLKCTCTISEMGNEYSVGAKG